MDYNCEKDQRRTEKPNNQRTEFSEGMIVQEEKYFFSRKTSSSLWVGWDYHDARQPLGATSSIRLK
jgi:hypothetical protein